MKRRILCARCHKPNAAFDLVTDSLVHPATGLEVTELCESCLGQKLVELIQENFRFLVTRARAADDGYTKIIIEGI